MKKIILFVIYLLFNFSSTCQNKFDVIKEIYSKNAPNMVDFLDDSTILVKVKINENCNVGQYYGFDKTNNQRFFCMQFFDTIYNGALKNLFFNRVKERNLTEFPYKKTQIFYIDKLNNKAHSLNMEVNPWRYLITEYEKKSKNIDEPKTNLENEINEVKKSTPETNKSVEFVKWKKNVYRNNFYQFRVEFPKNWEYDEGTSKITLARALERNKSAAISVTVKHLPSEARNPNNIFESSSSDEYERLFNEMLELQNMKPVNLKIVKGYLNNFPAYFINFISEMKSGETTYIMFSRQIQCYYKSKIYQVNLNIPLSQYDGKIETLFTRVYNSFNFEIAY